MDFEFTDDQLELRDNARSVLASACPPALVRTVFDGAPAHGGGLWPSLIALGWPAIGVDEANGGLGLSFVETGLVVEELGRVVAPAPFVATVTQFAALARETAAPSTWLRGVADGTLTGTVAVAEAGVWPVVAPADATRAESVDGRWVLRGVKSHVMDGATADAIAVVAVGDRGPGVFVVEPPASITPLKTIDPTMPLATLTLDGVSVDPDNVWVEPGDPRAVQTIERAIEEAVTALALSTVATCRVIFETTLQYAKDREQFGKPIGSFQALKHRFADMFLALEKASALAYFAALTIAEDDARRTGAASMAKAAASDCQRLLTRDGLQLHGGIGFTWEHDLHFWLKRAKSCEFLFGSGAAHRARLARLLTVVS